jgi:hypothetical protein
MREYALLVGASLTTISTPMIAQTPEAPSDQQHATSQNVSLAEIIVTACRRDEALTDVPAQPILVRHSVL